MSRSVRSCVGCRRRRSPSALVRVTWSEVSGVVVDGPSAGRGAWLCRDGEAVDAACLDRALRSRAFERAWRRAVDAHLEQAVRTALGHWRASGPAAESGPP